MVTARQTTTQSLPKPVFVTAGGVLWRRRAGEVEVCVISSPDRRTCAIPRGQVHEDERLSDSAVRCVRELTGYAGKPGRQLARASSEGGEVACLFLLQCNEGSRYESAARKITALWMPLTRAMDSLGTSAERTILRRAAEALVERVDPPLPFHEAGDLPVAAAAVR